MSIYKKSEKLAKEFDAVYPGELSERLLWWCKVLGIDRVRLLRMIGMSAQQAAEKKGKDLKELLTIPEWEENGQLLEGSLHRLLSLFHYDWHALAERVHEPVVKPEGEESSRNARRKGEVTHLRYTPSGDASDLLINRMSEGGPQSLPALLAYLAGSHAVAGQHES